MSREYFCAYHSYLDSIELLNDEERGRLFTALLEYSANRVLIQLDGNERFAFSSMRSQIDRDIKRYEEKCRKQSENARKRWQTQESDLCHGIPDDANDAREKGKERTNTKDIAKDKERTREMETERVHIPWSMMTPEQIRQEVLRRSSPDYC